MRKLFMALLIAFGTIIAATAAWASGIEQGQNLICDTKEQMERFIELRHQDVPVHEAIDAVNFEAQKDTACAIAPVAYIRLETVSTAEVDGWTVNIVLIDIKAVSNGFAWLPVNDYQQYTIFNIARVHGRTHARLSAPEPIIGAENLRNIGPLHKRRKMIHREREWLSQRTA